MSLWRAVCGGVSILAGGWGVGEFGLSLWVVGVGCKDGGWG